MAASNRSGNRRLVVFRLVLLGFSLGFSLLIAEVFLRIAAPQPKSWLAIYRPHPALPIYDMLPNKSLHVDTGETDWTILTDANGFRFDPELAKDSSCRVLWLGDSYAFGHGLDYDQSFVGVVDQRLDGVQTINASVSGYGPTQYRQHLEYLVGQGHVFDTLVVATYVGNDFHDTKWEKIHVVGDGIIGNENDLKSLLMRNLHLYRLGASVYHRFSPRRQMPYRKVIGQLARPEAWEEPFLSDAREIYRTEMRRIDAIGREQGAEVFFVIIPTQHAVATLYDARTGTESAPEGRPTLPIEHAREIVEEIGAPYVDITPAISENPPGEMFFQFDGHLTEAGSRIAAEVILEALPIGCLDTRGE